MKPEIEIKLDASTSAELIIREGKALDPKEPQVVKITGVLDSPLQWLLKRKGQINGLQAHVIVNRNDLRIKLTIDETNHYQSTITGGLELHPLFKKFGVNSGNYITNFEMAQLFKMNRTAFESITVAMSLVSELQNFRAKVEREIEKVNDNRGNKRDLLAQTVESNMPDTFNLVMPIFKGTTKQSFPVEVYIKPDDFSCTLISPVANDLIEEMRDAEIDKVLDNIREIAPEIAIIEQ